MTERAGPETIRAAVQEFRRLVEEVNQQAGRCAHLGLTVTYDIIPDDRITGDPSNAPILYAYVERRERY